MLGNKRLGLPVDHSFPGINHYRKMVLCSLNSVICAVVLLWFFTLRVSGRKTKITQGQRSRSNFTKLLLTFKVRHRPIFRPISLQVAIYDNSFWVCLIQMKITVKQTQKCVQKSRQAFQKITKFAVNSRSHCVEKHRTDVRLSLRKK